MPLPVSLEEVLEHLEMQMSETASFLHTETGELLFTQDHEIRQADQLAEGEIDIEDVPKWQQDHLPTVHEAVHSPEWIQLPTEWDIHEYKMMEEFCYSVEDEEHREELLRAIQGRGAFRYFRDTADRLGLTEDWYAFRDQAYEDKAIRWLEANDIPYERKPENAE